MIACLETVVDLRLAAVRREPPQRGPGAALAEQLPAIAGERDQLIQLIQNLADNAIKYGGEPDRVGITCGTCRPHRTAPVR